MRHVWLCFLQVWDLLWWKWRLCWPLSWEISTLSQLRRDRKWNLTQDWSCSPLPECGSSWPFPNEFSFVITNNIGMTWILFTITSNLVISGSHQCSLFHLVCNNYGPFYTVCETTNHLRYFFTVSFIYFPWFIVWWQISNLKWLLYLTKPTGFHAYLSANMRLKFTSQELISVIIAVKFSFLVIYSFTVL